MNDVKTYKLYLSAFFKIFFLGMLCVFTLSGFVLLIGILPFEQGEEPPMVFRVAWFGTFIWLWYWLLSVPTAIVESNNGEIVFSSILRKRHVTSTEILSITPDKWQFGFLIVRTSKGRIRLVNQFDGFHDFITRLKKNNPGVILRGC